MEKERCESSYENVGGVYREIKEGSLYPPHLGYSEFTTSTSSLGFETETFSELFFSSSSEDEDSSLDYLLGPETPGILYKISRQLDKVPRYFSSRKHLEEREDILDMPEDAEELLQLQDSVESMIEQIKAEESLFFYERMKEKEAVRSESPCENLIILSDDNENCDPVHSLNAIETQISDLIKVVEKEEQEIMKELKEKESSLNAASSVGHYCRIYSNSESSDSDEFDLPQVKLSVGKRFGMSTIDISTTGGSLKRQSINRSLPNMTQYWTFPPFYPFEDAPIEHSSSIEYITPEKGLGFVNSGYCIWTSDEELLEGSVDEPTKEDQTQKEKEIATQEKQLTPPSKKKADENEIKADETVKFSYPPTPPVAEESGSHTDTISSEPLKQVSDKDKKADSIKKGIQEFILTEKFLEREVKEPVLEVMKDTEYATSLDLGEYDNIQNEDVDRIIKEMESQLINSNQISQETETESEDSPKPYVTTPSLNRRGIGGSQRLQQEERPTVRIVTDFAEESSEEEPEEERAYYVTEPTERPKRRNVKFRFDSGDYRDDEESDKETEVKVIQVKTEGKIEKKFERMASETKENELEKSDGEFQKMVSQMSIEEMDEALQLWDKGGLTPSDLDSKSLTEPSDETSPQEGTQVLEDEEQTVQPPPPVPSPRAQSVPFKPPSEPTTPEEVLTNYTTKKLFWEQVSQGSTEKQDVVDKPPVPKPRLSISGSIEKPIYSEPSHKEEDSDIDKQETLSEATSTETVARGISKEESIDDSEIEYIQTHRDELSYDNDAFDLDDNIEELSDFSLRRKKKIFERSVSLPCDSSLDPSTSSVRTKKRIFEAQIKKEMVVEQLMSQLEEEASPEHKSLKQKTEKPVTDTQAMVTRQIHTEIFSDELDQQIDSLVPENKELRQQPFPKDVEKLEATFLETSSPETSISSSVAEVLHYKGDMISRPSDSLEVHVDKSELEESEKEKDLDDDMKAMTDTRLHAPYSREKEKVGSVTSSQGESEDTFSESDVTPEDSRYKEQQDIQEWTAQEIKPEKDKKSQSIYTPEEHLPDTVWEVPVQESTETLPEETVQQFPTELFKKEQDSVKTKQLTESEAREIAKEIVEDIEVEICKREVGLLETKLKKDDLPTEVKRPTEPLDVKFKRTDTTTSSMEITDEDLRSSGVDSDISPLESQACHVFRDDEQSRDDSSDDIENLELSSKETFGEDALEKTLAEVKESLEAVKEELIEEKKKKKDSITKESPSEFEFKVLSMEHQTHESIKESHYEEGTTAGESEKPSDIKYKLDYNEKEEYERSSSKSSKAEISLKHEQPDVDIIKTKEEITEKEKESISKEINIGEEKTKAIGDTIFMEDSHGTSSLAEEQLSSESQKYEESKVVGSGSSSLQTASTLESEQALKSSETYDYGTVKEVKKDNVKFQKTETKQDNKNTEEESKKKTETQSTEFISDDGTFVMKRVEKSEISTLMKIESIQQHTEKCVIQEIHRHLYDLDKEQKTDDEDEKSLPKDYEFEEKADVVDSTREEGSGEYSKSPVPEDTQEDTSSSSEVRMGSDTPPTSGEKPVIVIRKHSKTVSKIQGELSDPYSSSGESHYHSFEATSESLRTPGSRPLSSDVEGLVANLAGITGSSEYESAASGHSTTGTSRDFQTAVSSLSSRDSMKSLDSESSGNLASMEVSSEASETLVPSAMELDEEIHTPQPQQMKRESPRKIRSVSESNGQSVSFDISTEDISEDEVDLHAYDATQKMKRSHEMTFQPEPRPITEERLSSSVDDVGSAVSDSTAVRTVIELSRTESDKMDGSATSDQLTVSGTSEQLSFSESKDTESTMETKKGTVSTQFSQELGQIESVTITTSSVMEQGIQSVCTQVTSKTTSHSNGPTQVEYNIEYDEVESEVKKRPGHRRNGSTSFRPSMIPVFQGREFEKKAEDIIEDSAESDKYSQTLTTKEGSQEEKKDIDEAEKLEEEFYQTEADQGFHRDLREGRILKDVYEYEEYKSDKSRLSSVAFSEDRPDSELAELLKQCSTDGGTEDPIERPKTPEPIDECELKDDTPEFSSEAQASVTELEMEYSGAFSRSCEYEAHVSPIREKGLLWEHEADMAESEAAFQTSHFSSLPETIPEDPVAEKHELETQELMIKEEIVDRTSPVPGITITQHMTPLLDESFVFPDSDECLEAMQPIPEPLSSKASSETSLAGKEYNLETATTKSITSDDLQDETSHTEEKTVFEKDCSKEIESTSESPTSDSFELLEKPDLADDFVIIEEVGREAEEQDQEGKSVKISGAKRVIPRAIEKEVVSPPKTTAKMTKIKYYSKGGTEEEVPFEFESGTPPKVDEKEESSQEGSPPSAIEDDFKPEVEAGKKWMEMQFQGEPVAPIYGYEMEFERGPLEDIKEEELADLESSSKIGSMGSQVSYSIGSFGSVKESLSSTPDYDILTGRKFLTRSGEHDDISMSSLQEFERLENLIALESTKHKSLGSQDSLTSSSNSKKHGSRSGGDDISLASLKEFEGLESACIAAERIERKAKAEEESLLSEIEEGHESQASESESCVTVSVSGLNRESDEEDYDKRMFEIDEIIRQAQTNIEQFIDAKSKENLEKKLRSESLGHADSLEEMTKVPDLDLDQPTSTSKTYCGKTYITQWEDLAEDLLTSTDSLELKTQVSKASIADPFTTSTDSLEVKLSQDVMSVSTDSIEASQKKKALMTDSIEIGEKSSMITSTDSLEEKITQANSLDEEEPHPHSSSSGKEIDWSGGSGKDDGFEGSVNRMPPPRAEYMLGSSDSLEPTSSTATHATYQYETDSVMSSSFTSADSTTMVDDDGIEARASAWFDDGKPFVTEVIEPGYDEFAEVIHRTVEMPPEVKIVSFKGQEAEQAIREYIEKFDPGEDITETREVDADGNVHISRVIQKRVVVRPEEMGGDTTKLEGEELKTFLKSLTSSEFPEEPILDPSQKHIQSSSQRTVSQTTQGETIKSHPEEKETKDSQRRGGRPPLKYDISVDEEPEFDPREHDWRFNLHTHLERDEEPRADDTLPSSKDDKESKTTTHKK